MHDDNKVVFYTGFPSFASPKVCFEFLGPAFDQLVYWNGRRMESDGKNSGPPRNLPPMEEFFGVSEVATEFLEQDLADRFNL